MAAGQTYRRFGCTAGAASRRRSIGQNPPPESHDDEGDELLPESHEPCEDELDEEDPES